MRMVQEILLRLSLSNIITKSGGKMTNDNAYLRMEQKYLQKAEQLSIAMRALLLIRNQRFIQETASACANEALEDIKKHVKSSFRSGKCY